MDYHEGQAASRFTIKPLDLSIAVASAVSVAAASAFVVPVGFQGRDDLHYLEAAEQWLRGPIIGTNHWANRIPYVLAIAASRRVTGEWEAAFYLVHCLCFVAAAISTWLIALRCFGRRVAWVSTAIFCATPLLLRLPSVFYPEALEIALAGVTICMVFAWQQNPGKHAPLWLFTAGLIGGLVLSIRQTAIATPFALAVVMLISPQPLPIRLRNVGWLAVGYATPVLVELIYYWSFTGNPLHRLSVDSHHVEFVSPDRLAGGVPPHSTRVLFNWDLASRWQIPSTVRSHWTVAPIVRLFTSPGMLLTPWLALIGGVIAWRGGGLGRALALLVFLTISVQYVLNTFVLSLPPNTRYFGVSLALLCVLAGVALSCIRRVSLLVSSYALLFALPAAAVAIAEPRPSLTVRLVEDAANRIGSPIHLTGQLEKMEALRLRDRPELRGKITNGLPESGSIVAGLSYDRPPGWTRQCPQGGSAFRDVGEVRPSRSLWTIARSAGLARGIPHKIEALLIGEQDAVHLMLRRC